jgi:hypothetical protein
MNGRTVRKILMRGRTSTFFGARALFVVRVPLAAIPEPVPPFKAPGESAYEGCWTRDNEDGTRTLYSIPELHGFRNPTKRGPDKNGFQALIHHPVCRHSEIDPEDGTLDEDWVWYEGTKIVTKPSDTGKRPEIISQENLPLEMVEAYITKRRWFDKYVSREAAGGTGLPWLDALHEAAGYARRFQPLCYSQAGLIDLAYFVKWYNPRTKLWFCAAMSRALKLSKKMGIAVKVLRPPKRR